MGEVATPRMVVEGHCRITNFLKSIVEMCAFWLSRQAEDWGGQQRAGLGAEGEGAAGSPYPMLQTTVATWKLAE